MSAVRQCRYCGASLPEDMVPYATCPICLLTALGADVNRPASDETLLAGPPSVARTQRRRQLIVGVVLALAAGLALGIALVVRADRATREPSRQEALVEARREAADARETAAAGARTEANRHATAADWPGEPTSTPVAPIGTVASVERPAVAAASASQSAPRAAAVPDSPPLTITPANVVKTTPTWTSAPMVVKLATMAPVGSAWALVLKDLAAQWAVASGGTVRLVLYVGGVRGDDSDVVRALKVGELGAAVLGSNGLAELDRAVSALSMPMAYDSVDEADAVLAGMRSRLEASLEAKGFVVLNWADAGWDRFFSNKPVATPAGLRKLKLFQRLGDPQSLEIWKTAGFNPRQAAPADLPTGLSTGLFEACSMSLQVAAIGRYYERAKYMTDLDWARPIGATVVTPAVWNRIPADLRPALMQAAHEAEARMREEARSGAEASLATMLAAGLTVVSVDDEARVRWLALAEAMRASMRGATVPADAFDEALKFRDEYRARKR